MTKKEAKTYEVITKAIDGNITNQEAADALGISKRQVMRKKKDVKEKGLAGLIHKNTFQKPSNAISDSVRKRIITLKTSKKYKDTNIAHFREILSEHHGIDVSYGSLRSILAANGISSPLKRRRYKPHRRRKRKPQEGLLVQVDASIHPWFSRKQRYAIHGAIDDATGKVLGLYMTKNECMLGYFEMLRRTIEDYGIPVSLYADRHTIFRSPNSDKLTVEDQLDGKHANDTQFGRCLKELGIQLIAARSPQAKGRIERLWGTLQHRLPTEFKIHNIVNIDDANEFLKNYVDDFNSKFAVIPENTESAYLPKDHTLNIDYALCVKMQRVLDAGGVFSFYGKKFKVVESPHSDVLTSKTKVQILASPRIGIMLQYKSLVFDTTRFIEPKKAVPKKQKSDYIPHPNEEHPWRKDYSMHVDGERYQDIVDMLENIFTSKYA